MASPPTSTPWVPLWPLTPPVAPGVYRGQWLAEVAYNQGDIVVFGASYYTAIQPSLGSPPNAPQTIIGSPIWVPTGQNPGGLTLWFPMDDTGATLRDLAGANPVTAYTGAKTQNVTGAGGTSKAIDFTGGYVTITPNAYTDAIGPVWSLCAWIYPTAARTVLCGIVTKGAAANITAMLAMGGGGGPAGSVWAGWYQGGFAQCPDTIAPTLNTWYHYVGTWGGGNLKLYRNGVLARTVASGGSTPAISQPLYVARDHDLSSGANSIFPGRIDDVRIYRQVLTDTEIAALYAAGPANY